MRYKILKASLDGICGGEMRYESVEEVLREVFTFRGWKSKAALHTAIKKWAESASPGSVFCTQVSAIVCVGVTSIDREDDICHYCGHEGLDYSDIGPVEDGGLEQEVCCSECGKRWIDAFTLTDQRALCSKKKVAD